MKNSENLVRFANTIKDGLKNGDLWNKLSKEECLTLPKSEAFFLRSVENIKNGMGPLNNFKMMTAILKYVNFPLHELFGTPAPNGNESTTKKSSEKTSTKSSSLDELVQFQVEKALNIFIKKISEESIQVTKKAPSQNPRKTLELFREILYRTGLTAELISYKSAPLAVELLFESYSRKKANTFGHGTTNVKVIDTITDFIAKRPVNTLYFDYILAIAYQIHAFKILLKLFHKKSTENSVKLVSMYNPASLKSLQEICSYLDNVEESLTSLLTDRLFGNTESFKYLIEVLFSFQNGLTFINNCIINAPVYQNPTDDPSISMKLRLNPQKQEEYCIQLTYSEGWVNPLLIGLAKIRYLISQVQDSYDWKMTEFPDFSHITSPNSLINLFIPYNPTPLQLRVTSELEKMDKTNQPVRTPNQIPREWMTSPRLSNPNSQNNPPPNTNVPSSPKTGIVKKKIVVFKDDTPQSDDSKTDVPVQILPKNPEIVYYPQVDAEQFDQSKSATQDITIGGKRVVTLEEALENLDAGNDDDWVITDPISLIDEDEN